MAVYVDALCDHGWKLGPSCHLVADDLDELHAFAKRIGMKRQWFQVSCGGLPHYDLTRGRRQAAVALGAIEISRTELVARIKAARAKKEGD